MANYAKAKDGQNNWGCKFFPDPKLVEKLFFALKLMSN
jgi:hypothetical protein